MSVRTIVARGRRRQVQTRMTERIVIERLAGSTVDGEGREVTEHVTIYDGPGRLHSFRPHEQNPDVAAASTTVERVDWHIPAAEYIPALVASGKVAVWAGPVLVGDMARRVTPGKPEKYVRITGEHDVTDKTAQRLIVDDITGGVWQ